MKKTAIALVITAFAAVIPANATVFSASFTGSVYQTQGATGYSIGNTITGHFDLDNTTGKYLDFVIAGMSVASGFQSSAVFSIGGFDSVYTAQVSPVAVGGTSNNSFTLDLSSLTNWPSSDNPYTLLIDKNQLLTNLDTITSPLSAFPSTFGYYTANSNGTGIVAVSADLTSITATAPEPATMALLGSSLLGLGLIFRRRRR